MARQRTGEQNHVGILDRFRGRGAAAAAALGIGAMSLAGCSSPTEAQPPTVATSSAKPDAQPSASPSPTSSSHETTANPVDKLNPRTVLDGELYKSLTPEQQAEIQKYRNMPLAEFQKADRKKQLMYAQFVYDTYEQYAINQIKTQGDLSIVEYMPLEPLTEQGSGQDIVNWSSQQWSVALQMTHGSTSPYNFRPENLADAEKMLALMYTAPGSNQYNHALRELDRATTSLVERGSNGYDGATVMKEEPVSNNGQKRFVVLYNAENSLERMTATNFSDISGKNRVAWTLDYALAEGVGDWGTLAASK